MDITLTIDSPNNCGHLHIIADNGKTQQRYVLHIDELNDDSAPYPEAIGESVRQLIKREASTRSLKTLQQFKTVLEGKTHIL
jgi:hypothetical protein